MNSAKKWHDELKRYDDCFHEKFETPGNHVVDIYKSDESKVNLGGKFNILWSNTSILKPAVYAKPPKPEVSRRFKDKNPVARIASTMLERCLSYEISLYSDFDSALDNAVLDRLLPGRGIAWIRYEPETEMLTDDTQYGDDDGSSYSEEPKLTTPEPLEQIVSERCPTDYVYWCDFKHEPSRTWEECGWVARRVFLSEKEGVKRFGDVFMDVPLTHKPYKDDDVRNKSVSYELLKAEVWEIWCKKTKKVYWICEHYESILDEQPDPLNLADFFPCPKPLYATLTTDSLIPRSDYSRYQDQAEELDKISQKIIDNVEMLKIRGIYAGDEKNLINGVLKAENGDMISVSNFMALADKGGLKGMMELVDVSGAINALQQLYIAREQVKQTIYEISGISDILRGASDAQETLGAQQLKTNFASIRLSDMKNDVARFACDLLRMKAEIICEKYQPQTIVEMSGIQYLPEVQQNPELVMQALQMLKDERTRNFNIDIENDSLVEMDERKEQENRIQFLEASASFIEKAAMIGGQVPELVPLFGEMLLFGIRGFKVGNTIEASFESAFDQLVEKSKMPQPDPEQMQAEAQMQMEQMQMQAEQAMQQQQEQHDQELEDMKADKEIEAMKIEADREIARMQEETKLKIAAITARSQVMANKKDNAVEMDEDGEEAPSPVLMAVIQQMQTNTQMLAQAMAEQNKVLIETLTKEISRPKTLSRDANGNKIAVPVPDTLQ